MKEDLKKGWGRLERCWNPKTREDKVEFYTKFLNYKLENVRQRPMDWSAFLERKRTELANTGHIMDDETFSTHLLSSLPQAEYKGAILAIKERLRRSTYDLAEIEQILEDKYQSMKYVKGWEEEEDDYALFASPANKKGHKNSSKDDVTIVEKLQFSLFLISWCPEILKSSWLSWYLLLKIACLHVSFTAYDNFYKLSKIHCLLVWFSTFQPSEVSENRDPTIKHTSTYTLISSSISTYVIDLFLVILFT